MATEDYLTFNADLNDPDVVSTYDELPLWSAMFGLVLLKHVVLRRRMKVLDVGCGTGFPLIELAQRLGPTGAVHGVDPWGPALERARLKVRGASLQNVDIRQGDAAALPFPDGAFDLVVSNLGINNFRDPEAALAECRRVLRPSAPLALTTNLQGHMREFYDVFASTLRELGKERALPALKAHIETRATVARIKALLSRTGFSLSKVHEESASMRFVDGSALLRHAFIKLGFLPAWKGVLEPSDQEEVFSRLEANLNRLAEARGELSLTIPIAYIEGERAP
jgi:arsenite methyltransferase